MFIFVTNVAIALHHDTVHEAEVALKTTACSPRIGRASSKLSIEAGGGYRFSSDSISPRSPFLGFVFRPEALKSFSPSWGIIVEGDFSISQLWASELDLSFTTAVAAQYRNAAVPFFAVFTAQGGYFRFSEPLMNDPWKYVSFRTMAEGGIKTRNSISIQHVFEALNHLPSWLGRQQLRFCSTFQQHGWLRLTVQTGYAFARSQEIVTAKAWDSTHSYTELSAVASGIVMLKEKNTFSGLFRLQHRRLKITLVEPIHGASQRDVLIAFHKISAYAASLNYCRSISQHLDFFIDCTYAISERYPRRVAWESMSLGVWIAWYMGSL